MKVLRIDYSMTIRPNYSSLQYDLEIYNERLLVFLLAHRYSL